MIPALAAYATVWAAGVGYLWWEGRRFDRHVADALAVARPTPGFRCLACPDAPAVADPRTHSRLFHLPREVGPEDRPDWGVA